MAIQDREADNTVLREYTWGLNLGGGISGLIDLKQNGQNYAYLYDGKGNVVAILDNSEAVVATYQYDPFGILLAQTGSLTQPFGFSTKRYDTQTGLIYYGHRYYSPAIGRWTTRDPLSEAGGMNLYEFVGNNPVNWVDPWGLMTDAATMDQVVNNPVVNNPLTWPEILLGLEALVAVGTNPWVLATGVTVGIVLYPSTTQGPREDAIPIPAPIPMAKKKGPKPWDEKKPGTTPRDQDISKKPVKPIKEPRIPGGNGCAELERLIWDPETSPAVKSAARMLYILGGCGSLNQ